MSSQFFAILLLFLLFLLFSSIAMSAYLLYDIYSGNCRRLLSSQSRRGERSQTVRETRSRNLGE